MAVTLGADVGYAVEVLDEILCLDDSAEGFGREVVMLLLGFGLVVVVGCDGGAHAFRAVGRDRAREDGHRVAVRIADCAVDERVGELLSRVGSERLRGLGVLGAFDVEGSDPEDGEKGQKTDAWKGD